MKPRQDVNSWVKNGQFELKRCKKANVLGATRHKKTINGSLDLIMHFRDIFSNYSGQNSSFWTTSDSFTQKGRGPLAPGSYLLHGITFVLLAALLGLETMQTINKINN
uniref:Uncharacterized protein n=1 Tax=Romanomermis culicivorax TaxID=13658 RepID=A0A915I3Y5_ROMCU